MDISWSHPFPLDQCMTAESYSYSVNYMKSIISTIGHPPYMSNTYSFFNIVTMAMYTTLIQYQHNIVRHRRYFFDVNIVDFATSTVFNRYRVYTVDFADISLTFTSSTWQCIRCWTDIEFTLVTSQKGYDVDTMSNNIAMLTISKKERRCTISIRCRSILLFRRCCLWNRIKKNTMSTRCRWTLRCGRCKQDRRSTM